MVFSGNAKKCVQTCWGARTRQRLIDHGVPAKNAVVTGALSGDHTALEATLACFPAGTLSGAPKVRAMEIIDRLEKTRRGLYGGAVGYFDFAGNADTAIAIRTALLKGGVAYVQSGAGIVADSVPQTEDAEITNKAAAVLRAVRAANSVRRLA